jgi:hypothetical protein
MSIQPALKRIQEPHEISLGSRPAKRSYQIGCQLRLQPYRKVRLDARNKVIETDGHAFPELHRVILSQPGGHAVNCILASGQMMKTTVFSI